MIRYRRIGGILLAGALLGGIVVGAMPEQTAQAAEQAAERGTSTLTLMNEQAVSYTLRVHETVQLIAPQPQPSDTPANGGSGETVDDTSIRWASENQAVATVNADGLVTAVAKGQTEIYGARADGSILTCKLTVTGEAATAILLDKRAVNLTSGEQTLIHASLQPSGCDAQITWRSDNEAVARVDSDGRVTADNVGTAIITASADAVTASCTVSVTASTPQPDTPDDDNNNNNNNNNNNTNNNTNGNNNAGGGTNTITQYPSYNGTVGSGGTLYMPGSTIPSSVIRTYTMPNNVPSAAFLTIESDMGANTTAALTQLKQYSISATFFVPVGDLYASDNLLRQIAGEGHTIGLLLTPEQAKDPAAAVTLLNTANEQLSVITGTPSRIVRVLGGSAASLTKEGLLLIQGNGYRVWDWNSTPGSYDAAVKALDTTGTITLRLDSSATTTNTLQQLLPYMQYCGIPAKGLSAGDTPVCQIS